MTDLTPCERGWVGVLDELRSCAALRVSRAEQGPVSQIFGDAPTEFANLEEFEDISLDASLQRCYFRFVSIAASWEVVESETSIAGEFDVAHLSDVLSGDAPELGWPNPTADERELLSQLRGFDGTTITGVGHLTALRIQPGVGNPELWFDAGPLGVHRLDIDYCTYLDVLRVTKGTFGWQYLFTEVSLAQEDYVGAAQRLSEMLDLFPRLFPAYDYSDLRARLEARL
ncbi:hypothetical protein [Streptomyces violaceus]|jgi:hypothetical protein|uniref:Uncharacterized protein n=1 Tax=Streptomyces violaceus TaxID=1936 RepID=A0ABY9UIN3_STRVL|nr:hypothetical protein [Streptomyces janthinus]WND22726.1 hypothetical protein RI060_37615 [Streptomyces janthinus]GGS97630.1 hypothetical protein GCM10010270_82010 [Streptomyces janthinus]